MTTTLPAAGAIAGDAGSLAGLAHEPRLGRRVLTGVLVALVVLGVVARFVSRGALWLDEALTVNIASLPPGQLLKALRVDGSPPLYYLTLHVWMDVFGRGTVAVRSLSGIYSAAALVPAWFVGRRLGGARVAAAGVTLLACAPFAIRFASETRMYSLVLLEVCLAGLLVLRALERPSLGRLAPVSIVVAALAYTHYWTFFVLAAAALLLLAARRWRVLCAFVAAGVLFAPQLPTLVSQLRHTGTPWANPAVPRAAIDTLLAWGGPTTSDYAPVLGAVMALIALLGAVATRDRTGQLVLAPRAQRVGVVAGWLSVGTLVLAVAATMVAGAGFVERYTAIAVPAYTLLIAWGLSLLPRRAGVALLVGIAVVGLGMGHADAIKIRTQAAQIGAFLTTSTAPGDVIVYCPDQLAPAVHRVAPSGRTEISYGDDLGPTRVDWVDYAQRNATLDPVALASSYDLLAGPRHSVALVWNEGYRTLTGQCSALANALTALRPAAATLVQKNPATGEPAQLTVYYGS